MRKGKSFKWLLGIALVLTLALSPIAGLLGFSGLALAAISAEVNITATPSYVSITNSPDSWAIGTITTTTDYWWNDTEPGFPLDDTNCTATITNTGSVDVNVTIQGFNWTGGDGWVLGDAGGDAIVAVKAGISGTTDEPNMTVLNGTAGQPLKTGLTWDGTNTTKWEMMIESPTNFTDGIQKNSTVTLTAAA